MEFDSYARKPASLDLTSLIDVVFILVIFIVLAANFERIKQLEVSLPETQTSGRVDPKSLVITVPPEGPIRVQDESLALEAVGERLKSLRERYDKVLLVADRDASVQRAVQVLGDARRAGFGSVGIASSDPRSVTP